MNVHARRPAFCLAILAWCLSAAIAGAHAPTKPTGTAPAITTQPATQSVASGANAVLTVVATGSPAPTYQWNRNGRPIRGAAAASYSLTGAKPADADVYSVTVSNVIGRVTSLPAYLSVANAGAVSAAPKNQSVTTGSTLTLAVTAAGTGLKYQWLFDDIAISGATGATYSVANVGPGAAGTYTVQVSNASALIAADLSTVAVTTSARLTNLSVRGQVGTGTSGNSLTLGFVTDGSASKKILLRAIGPTLGTNYAVSGSLGHPSLTLYGFWNKVIGTNSGWGGSTALSAVFTQVGAFALPASSADAALVETLAAGGYSAQVTGVSGATGVALAEIYDADTGTPTASLVNVSASAYVAGGSNVLVAGFVVAGSTSDTILVRGVGPTLKSSYGVKGALPSTVVTLYNSKGVAITANAGWGNNPLIANTSSKVGAFPLMPNSQDSALLVTVPVGAYTAQVTGANGATGTGMVEIYEVK